MMNNIVKIKKSWWNIFSFILFFNGFGFIFHGIISQNKNWVIEGVVYEIPTIFFCLCAFTNQIILRTLLILCVISVLVSLIRSIRVDVKYLKACDNYEYG